MHYYAIDRTKRGFSIEERNGYFMYLDDLGDALDNPFLRRTGAL